MTDEKYPKKAYCWKSDCKEGITGFNIEQYFICSTCKEEITPALYKIIKERREKEVKNDKEDDDLQTFWDQH